MTKMRESATPISDRTKKKHTKKKKKKTKKKKKCCCRPTDPTFFSSGAPNTAIFFFALFPEAVSLNPRLGDMVIMLSISVRNGVCAVSFY